MSERNWLRWCKAYLENENIAIIDFGAKHFGYVYHNITDFTAEDAESELKLATRS